MRGELPYASVFISPPEDSTLNLEIAAKKIKSEADRLWEKLKIRSEVDLDDMTASIEFSLPESREELLALLVKNDARGFIQCMADHFETMARLTPVLDELFQAGKPKARKRR